MSKKQRKPPTLKERMTPCILCFHPLSQKHHLLSFSIFGEKGVGTAQLCANCHDIYHMLERYYRKKYKERDYDGFLFDVQTEEERLIHQVVAYRAEYTPLAHLAIHVALFAKVFSQEGDYDSFCEKDKLILSNCWDFAANFRQHVEKERQKRDEWFKSSGAMNIFDDLFAGREGNE